MFMDTVIVADATANVPAMVARHTFFDLGIEKEES